MVFSIKKTEHIKTETISEIESYCCEKAKDMIILDSLGNPSIKMEAKGSYSNYASYWNIKFCPFCGVRVAE